MIHSRYLIGREDVWSEDTQSARMYTLCAHKRVIKMVILGSSEEITLDPIMDRGGHHMKKLKICELFFSDEKMSYLNIIYRKIPTLWSEDDLCTEFMLICTK